MLQPGCSQSAQVGGVPAWVRLSTTQKFLKLPDYGLLEQNIGTCGQAELEKYSSGAPATLVLCLTGRHLLKKMNTFPHCGLTLIVLISVLIIWIQATKKSFKK